LSVSPPRDGEAAASGAGTETAGLPRCPRCGTPHEPNQEYCLECGLRLPAEPSGIVPRLNRAWRRRLGWYPGDWIWPSLLALVIAALAGLGAAAFVSHEYDNSAYATETSGFTRVTSTLTPPEHTTATTPTAPTGTRQQPPPPPPRPQTLKAWPVGESGWTVVLQSLPTTNGRAFALAQARAALHSGVPDVGILDSSRYSSLHPGYYVLFSGVYTSFDDANTAVTTARSHGYPRAYARRITP
jgi:cell division septation protein DedD